MSQEIFALDQEAFAGLFSPILDLVCIISSDGRFKKLNQAWATTLGYPLDELIDTPYLDFVYPDDMEATRLEAEKLFSGGAAKSFINRYRCKDGAYRWLEWRSSFALDKKQLFAAARDITEQRRIEESLKISSFTVDNMADAVYWVASDGRLLNVNNAACRMLGYSRDDLLSLSLYDIDPVFPRGSARHHKEALKQAGCMRFETCHRTKDGRVFPVEITANFFSHNGMEYSCAIARDITERKKAEEELLQSEERYHLLFDRMLNGCAICEAICDAAGQTCDFRFLEVNPAFESNTGLAHSAVVGKTMLELLPETESYWIEWFGRVALTGLPSGFVAFHRQLDRHFQASAFSLGKSRFAVALNDISDRVRMEQSLLESECREKARATELSAVMASVPAIVLIAHDPECRLVTGNHAACDLLRISPDGNFSKCAPDGESPNHYRIFRNGVETPTHELPVQRAARGEEIRDYEEEFVFEDGSRRTLLGNATPLRDTEGRLCGAVSTFVDISERKEMERALRESEEQFRILCDFAPIGIFKTDRVGNNVYCNRRWEEISGLSANESLGQGWRKALHPDEADEKISDLARGGETRSQLEYEFRLLTPLGKTIWVRVLASPLPDHEGNVTGYVGTVEDISELRQARQELLKSQKLDSLGVLAGGIAHDFNNILTAILGNISLARIQLADPEKAGKRLAEAEGATARAKELTQQLLTFARGGEPVKKSINVGALLQEAAGFASHGTAVKCDFALPENLWPVEADEGQLSQVIHNLVINAVQAMPDGGTIRIGAENRLSQQKGERSVRISVADTGTGIPEVHLQRIFDPYFTTKQQGSGLGLATCYSIVRKHGGTISVTSAMGRGSTFHVDLPAAPPGREVVETRTTLDVDRGCGLILVMDDEDAVREAMEAMLEELGYSVECAAEGTGAVELFRKRKEADNPFAAAILDLTIPGGVGGREVIAALRTIDPDVKAVVSSGYSTDPVMANYREHGFAAVLAKPYRLQEISRVLQELLHH